MSANTAIHIVALPNRASTKKTALIPSARLMFCQRIALRYASKGGWSPEPGADRRS